MAGSKNPYLRYRILHACFSSEAKKYWTIQELQGRLREHDLWADKRSLERDFQTMRYDERLAFNAPIAYSRTNNAYYYREGAPRIEGLPLAEEDLDGLMYVANVMNVHGEARLSRVRKTIEKIIRYVRPTSSLLDAWVVDTKASFAPVNWEYFHKILTAIFDKKPLLITSHRTSTLSNDVFHPYALKQFEFVWYAMGYSANEGRLVAVSLGKITEMRNTGVPFRQNTIINSSVYFNQTYGVEPAIGTVEEIIVLFRNDIKEIIKMKPFHESQQVLTHDEKGMLIMLTLVPNCDLLHALLIFGYAVEVKKPDAFRQKWLQLLTMQRK